MGSAQSARRTQPGGGSAARGWGPASAGPASALALCPRRAHFLRGGASRPALGRPGRAARRWLGRVIPSELYSAPLRLRRFPRGRGIVSLRPARPSGAGHGAPCPRRDCRPGRTALSASRPRRAARAGTGPRNLGARGQRRCRLPTRPVLKHGPRSLTRARVRGSTTPRGAMKVKAGARRPRWDPVRSGVGRTTGPPRPHRRGGGARARAIGPERW